MIFIIITVDDDVDVDVDEREKVGFLYTFWLYGYFNSRVNNVNDKQRMQTIKFMQKILTRCLYCKFSGHKNLEVL